MVTRRGQHRVCLVTTNHRAIVLPERSDDQMGRVSGGTRLGNSEMSAIFEELAFKGWILEPTTGTRLKAFGPDGEGPVFLSMRATGREVMNQKNCLRKVGFVFDGDSPRQAEEEEESVIATPNSPALILPVTRDELPAPIWEMLNAFGLVLRDEFAARQGEDAEEWQRLYQEETEKNTRLEEVNRELVRRAERAEEKWKKFQELLRD